MTVGQVLDSFLKKRNDLQNDYLKSNNLILRELIFQSIVNTDLCFDTYKEFIDHYKHFEIINEEDQGTVSGKDNSKYEYQDMYSEDFLKGLDEKSLLMVNKWEKSNRDAQKKHNEILKILSSSNESTKKLLGVVRKLNVDTMNINLLRMLEYSRSDVINNALRELLSLVVSVTPVAIVTNPIQSVFKVYNNDNVTLKNTNDYLNYIEVYSNVIFYWALFMQFMILSDGKYKDTLEMTSSGVLEKSKEIINDNREILISKLSI